MTPEKQIEEQTTNPMPQYNDVPPVRFKEKDDFDREIIADNIIKLLNSDLTDCYPMAIDGGWGTGKSEFCHKLINKLRDNAANYKPRNVIYFDAFEAENVEEPLLSLLAKITEVVPESERESVVSKIVPVAKYGLRITLKGLVNHFFRQNDDAISEGFHEAITDEAKNVIDSLLKEYSQAKSYLEALKDCLHKALQEKELVIFIDELDRCRPDFALNVFELVKHVFDINGVKFIFVFNSEQIKSMIKNRYGEDVDTDTYLEKFIITFISLPQNSSINNFIINNSIKTFMEYGKGQNIYEISGHDQFFNPAIISFFEFNKFSLRKTNEIIKNIKLLISLNKDSFINKQGPRGCIYIEIIGVFIFTTNQEFAKKIYNHNTDFSEVRNYFGGISNERSELLIESIINGERLPMYLEDKYDTDDKYFEHFLWLFESVSPVQAQKILRDTIKTLNFCG